MNDFNNRTTFYKVVLFLFSFFGIDFQFVTCIVSVIALFYILKKWNLQDKIIYYIVLYTLGGCALFFLTALSNQPPAAHDRLAWFYWTFAHGIFGLMVGFLVNRWIRKKIISQ